MAIFSSLAGFFKRNKRRILVTSAVGVSVYYLVNHFVISKFRNFQNSLQQELYIKEQIKRRFIQTQNDCYYTLLALLPVLVAPIVDNSPIELITKALKLKKSNLNSNASTSGNNKEISDSLLTTDNLTLHSNSNENDLSLYLNKSKTDLWKLLKLKTLTRFLTLNYSISSLLLLTRLQLNILARKSYLQSAISMTNSRTSPDPFDNPTTQEDYFIEQSYLSLSWWLLNKGWERLNYHIEAIVEEKFKLINARTELSVENFNDLLLQSIEEINSNKELVLNSIWPNLDDLNLTLLNTTPSLINEYHENFLKLINETNLIINNEFFMKNLTDLVTTNLSTLTANLVNNFVSNNNMDPIDLNQINVKLANLLAQLSIQCEIFSNNNASNTQIIDMNDSNEFNDPELSGNIFINNLNSLEALDDFSASIYSNIE